MSAILSVTFSDRFILLYFHLKIPAVAALESLAALLTSLKECCGAAVPTEAPGCQHRIPAHIGSSGADAMFTNLVWPLGNIKWFTKTAAHMLTHPFQGTAGDDGPTGDGHSKTDSNCNVDYCKF